MKKLITIIFLLISSYTFAQKDVFVDQIIGVVKPLKYDTVKQTISLPKATSLQDGYITKELIKRLDSLGIYLTTGIVTKNDVTIQGFNTKIALIDSKTVNLITITDSLKAELVLKENRIRELEINLQILADSTRNRNSAQLQIIIEALEKLKVL